MAVRQRTGDAKTLRVDGHRGWMALEQQAHPRHNGCGPLGEIGERAVLDFTLQSEGLAQQDTWGRVPVGDGLDVHGDKYTDQNMINQGNTDNITWLHITAKKCPATSNRAVRRAINESNFGLVKACLAAPSLSNNASRVTSMVWSALRRFQSFLS